MKGKVKVIVFSRTIILLKVLAVVLILYGGIVFVNRLQDNVFQQARQEVKEEISQNLRFIKAGVEGRVTQLEQQLEACLQGGAKIGFQPQVKTGFQPKHRPGMALADGGGDY